MLLALVGWVGVRGLIAKAELEAALPLVSEIKDQLKSVNLVAAQSTVATVADKTANARSLTSDPVWRLLEGVPWAGPNLTAFRELAAVTDDIAQNVMVPAAALGDVIDPSKLKPVDGRLDLAPFESAAPVVSQINASLDSAVAALDSVDTSGTIGPIRDAHKRMVSMLAPMIPLMDQADGLVTLLPSLLGADGPRSYLIVFMNNAEARSLGGHAGSWAQIDVDDGAISLSRQSGVHDLKTGGYPVYALTDEQLAFWEGAGTDPANVAMVPDLETAASTAAAFWKNRTAVMPDAVIFIDPVALGYLLKSTGPITLPTGDVVDSTNAASFLLNGVYTKYVDPAQQDVVFESISKLMFGAVLGGSFDPGAFFSAAFTAGKEHRMLVWSFHDDQEELFQSLPFGLKPPTITDTVAQFGLYVTDNLGSKMTYYLDADVLVGQAQCTDGTGQYRVQVTLTNRVTAEEGAALPTYVANQTKGTLRALISLYAPPGAQFVRELATGWDPTFVTINGVDGDNAAMTQRVILAPQESVTGTFVLTAPDGNLDRRLQTYVTPLARATKVGTLDFTC